MKTLRITSANPCEIFYTTSGDHVTAAHANHISIWQENARTIAGSYPAVSLWMHPDEARELVRVLQEAIACTQEYQDAQAEAQAASDEVTL